MPETIRFRSETIAWWSALHAAAESLGRVHRWDAVDHGPRDRGAAGMEQHGTETLLLCLAGTARIEDGRTRIDLARGDAVVIGPGAWHSHAPLRAGAIVYQQGVFGGRSDFWLESADLTMVATWPEEPARRYLTTIHGERDEKRRRATLAALLAHLRHESAEPLTTQGSAITAMEMAMWQNLHRTDVIARVVAASGRSRAQAYRLYRAHWGKGIATMVRNARLELARALLTRPLPVSEVAARVGIRERSVFARAYRRRWGKAPSHEIESK